MEEHIRPILEEIKSSDEEATAKLTMLGLTDEQVKKARQHLIDQEHEPDFAELAISCKSGMY